MNSKTIMMIAILVVLLLGGAGFGLYTMKQNTPSFRGIGLNVKGIPEDLCEEWETKLTEATSRDDVLMWVLEEADYAAVMEVPAGDALADLKGRIDVRYKKNRDVIEVGLTGKRKEDEKLNGIAEKLFHAVRSILAQQDSRFLEFAKSKAGQ